MKTDSEVMSLLSEHKMLMKLSTHKKQDDASYKVCIIYRYQLICTRKSNLALTNLYFTEYSKHVKLKHFTLTLHVCIIWFCSNSIIRLQTK